MLHQRYSSDVTIFYDNAITGYINVTACCNNCTWQSHKMLHQRYSNAETILCDNAMRGITDSTSVYAVKQKKRREKIRGKRQKHQWYNNVATIVYDDSTKCYINATTALWQCYNKLDCWKEGQRQGHLKISWSALFFSSDTAVRDKRITECYVFQLWLWPWRDITELCTFDFTILTNQRKTLFNEFRLDLQINIKQQIQNSKI